MGIKNPAMIRNYSATMRAALVTTLVLSAVLAYSTVKQYDLKREMAVRDYCRVETKSSETESPVVPVNVNKVMGIDGSPVRDEGDFRFSVAGEMLSSEEYMKDAKRLNNQGKMYAFRSLMEISALAVGLMFLVIGYKFSFVMLKQLASRKRTRQSLRDVFAEYFIKPYLKSNLLALGVGYVAGSVLGLLLQGTTPEGAEVLGLGMVGLAMHMSFSAGMAFIACALVMLGYYLDLIYFAAPSERQERESGTSTRLPEDVFNDGGSTYYVTFGIFGLLVWAVAVGIVYSKYVSGVDFAANPQKLSFESLLLVKHQLSGWYLSRVVAFPLVVVAVQVGLLYLARLVVLVIRDNDLFEKPDHRAQRAMLLVLPPLVAFILSSVVLRLLALVFSGLDDRTVFDYIALVLMIGLPSAAFAPLLVVTSASGTVSVGSRRPFGDAFRASTLYLYHVLRSNKLLTVVSFVFSLYFIVSWQPVSQSAEMVNMFSVGLSLWLLPIFQSLVSFEEVCQASYRKYLAQSFRRFGNHFVIGGYGDLGQRVAVEVTQKAMLEDKFGIRRFLDGADIILPDTKLAKLWTGMVVIDCDRSRFHFVTRLDNGIEAGIAMFHVSKDQNTDHIMVPAIVGNVEDLDVTTAARLPRAKFFACLVREHWAPLLSVQAIHRLVKNAGVPAKLPTAIGFGQTENRVSFRFGEEPVAPRKVPVCVLTTSNQPQYDAVIKDVHRNLLPVHVMNISYLESLQFAGRVYACYKKFRRYRNYSHNRRRLDGMNRIPRVMFVGKGRHILHATETFFRCLTEDEVDTFVNESKDRFSFVIVSDFEDIRRFCQASIPCPDVDSLFGGDNWKGPFNPNWLMGGPDSREVPCLELTGFVRTAGNAASNVGAKHIKVPVLQVSSMDWAPVLDVMARYRPDIIAVTDFDYVDQQITLGNVIAAVQRNSDKWKSSFLPMPEILVCRENGPRGGGVRRKVNRMLAEYGIEMRDRIKEREDDYTKIDRKYYFDYVNTFPSQALFFGSDELHGADDKDVAEEVEEMVVDVLDELVSRVSTLADTPLPKSSQPEARLELDLCLPERPGMLARFWADILLDKEVVGPGIDEEYQIPLLSLLHIENDMSERVTSSDKPRFLAKTYAFLGKVSGEPLPENRASDCSECQRFGDMKLVGHGLGGRNPSVAAAIVESIKANLEQYSVSTGRQGCLKDSSVDKTCPEQRCRKGECPKSLYCGLDDLCKCLGSEHPGSFAMEGKFEFGLPVAKDFVAKGGRYPDFKAHEMSPFAFLEFGGPDSPGAACTALNALLFNRIFDRDPGSLSGTSVDVKFLSDYQCSSEDQARVLMFCHVVRNSGDSAEMMSRRVDMSVFGLDTLTIRPVVNKENWLEYATNLHKFLNRYDTAVWHLTATETSHPRRPVRIVLERRTHETGIEIDC